MENKVILLHYGLPPTGRLEVLAHEAAHHLEPEALRSFSDEKDQLFADVVSTLVMRKFGIDNLAVAVKYMALYREWVGETRKWEREIREAVEKLTEGW